MIINYKNNVLFYILFFFLIVNYNIFPNNSAQSINFDSLFQSKVTEVFCLITDFIAQEEQIKIRKDCNNGLNSFLNSIDNRPKTKKLIEEILQETFNKDINDQNYNELFSNINNTKLDYKNSEEQFSQLINKSIDIVSNNYSKSNELDKLKSDLNNILSELKKIFNNPKEYSNNKDKLNSSKSNKENSNKKHNEIKEKENCVITILYYFRYILIGFILLLTTIFLYIKRENIISFLHAFLKKDSIEEKVLHKQIESSQKFSEIIQTEQKKENIQNTKPLVKIDFDKNKLKHEKAIEVNDFLLIGDKIIGKSHIRNNKPCQDSFYYLDLGDGWGIAVVSDGAGSAKLSDIGSNFTVELATNIFKQSIFHLDLISKKQFLPLKEWSQIAIFNFLWIKNMIEVFSRNNQLEASDLACTIIVTIYSPFGLLTAHIGDGRAGYKDSDGEWKSMMTPHKGEEANQTIFITSDWVNREIKMSGVPVPECRVIEGDIKAFMLMSDGCEAGTYECLKYDESKGRYFDVNMPYAELFDHLYEKVIKMKNENKSIEEMNEKWADFLKDGNRTLEKEPDDKTMIFGVKI
jgi:hypothetical protein